jgi:signal peptidase I
MGLPGDTIAVVDKALLINGRRTPLQPTMNQRWRVTAAGGQRPLAPELAELGVTLVGDVREEGRLAIPRQFDVVATPAGARRLSARTDVARVEPWFMPRGLRVGSLSFPPGSNSNPDQFGPVVVPIAGRAMRLDSVSWPMLYDVITRHEGHEARELPGGRFEIDGRVATSYTPAQDYFFVMGDSRDNSVDGRYWGYVPRDHLVGKATFVLMSFDNSDPLLGFIPRPRFGRFFRAIP